MPQLRSSHAALVLMATAALWLSASSAQAAIVSFVVTPQSVPGASVDVALRISDLGDAAAPSLGAFDLDVVYDPAVLASPTVLFGDPALGDQLDLFGLGALGPTATPSIGSINLFEVSLDLAADLDALQAGAFTLATLTFAPLATGTSSLEISINALADAQGDPLGATLVPASVTVRPIPEPATLMLVGAGLGCLLLYRRRRSSA